MCYYLIMADSEGLNPTESETLKQYPYDAIVVLPYTRVEKDTNPKEVKMSHFTSRAILAGWELYDQKQAPLFLLPGEQDDPSTSQLERGFLENNRKVNSEAIIDWPNLNGTLQQLEPIAELQKKGEVGRVQVVAFEFHMKRTREIMDELGIIGDVVEVEQTHADYLKSHHTDPTKVIDNHRNKLVGLQQLEEVKVMEAGARKSFAKDKELFGSKAPGFLKGSYLISKLTKKLAGPTITDIRGYEGSTGKKAETVLTLATPWKRTVYEALKGVMTKLSAQKSQQKKAA